MLMSFVKKLGEKRVSLDKLLLVSLLVFALTVVCLVPVVANMKDDEWGQKVEIINNAWLQKLDPVSLIPTPLELPGNTLYHIPGWENYAYAEGFWDMLTLRKSGTSPLTAFADVKAEYVHTTIVARKIFDGIFCKSQGASSISYVTPYVSYEGYGYENIVGYIADRKLTIHIQKNPAPLEFWKCYSAGLVDNWLADDNKTPITHRQLYAVLRSGLFAVTVEGDYFSVGFTPQQTGENILADLESILNLIEANISEVGGGVV